MAVDSANWPCKANRMSNIVAAEPAAPAASSRAGRPSRSHSQAEPMNPGRQPQK